MRHLLPVSMGFLLCCANGCGTSGGGDGSPGSPGQTSSSSGSSPGGSTSGGSFSGTSSSGTSSSGTSSSGTSSSGTSSSGTSSSGASSSGASSSTSGSSSSSSGSRSSSGSSSSGSSSSGASSSGGDGGIDGGKTCTANIGGSCGPYAWSGWPGSNGYNTYVGDQAINVQTGGTGEITVSGPSLWSATGHYVSCNGCVQTFNAVQQLTNNWGTRGWNGANNTPMSALSSLTISYTESSPTDSNDQYEFSPDIWLDPYAGVACGGCGDVMMWVDTSSQRCSAVGGWTVLGHPVLGGQNWTAYVAPGGGTGQEIIMILDGSGGSGTCATQRTGTIPVLAAIQWLSTNPGSSGFPAFSKLQLTQLNTGWEITLAGGSTFQVSNLAYNVTLAP